MKRHPAVIALFLSALAGASVADEPPDLSKAELARRGSEAMAVVNLASEPFTTLAAAVCVHPSGLFVTFAEPILHPTEARERFTMVLRPGRPDESIVEARVLRRLRDPGLVLLRVEGAKGLVALPPGDPASIDDLMDVAAFDLPTIARMPPAGSKYPVIRVAEGTVSATQRKDGQLDRIQFDAPLSKGAVSGALVDAKGRFLGVIMGQARANFGAGVGLAIPVNVVERFLNTVEVTLKPPTVDSTNLLRPLEFSALAETVFPSEIPLDVELILGGESEGRRYPMTLRDGAYRAKVAPASKPLAPLMVQMEATFDDGVASGLVEDQIIEVAGSPAVRLHEIRRLTTRPRAVAVLGTGITIEGDKANGLGESTVTIGRQAFSVDLTKARTIVIKPADDYPSLACSVVARRSGHELGRRDEPLYQEDRVSPCLESLERNLFIRPPRCDSPTTYVSFAAQRSELPDSSMTFTFAADQVRVALAERGQILQLDATTGKARGVTRSNARRGVVVQANEWKFTFEAPGYRSLATGNYPDARGMDIKGEFPEFSVAFPKAEEDDYDWDNGQHQGNASRFVVWELEVEGDRVARLAIDFAGRCEWRNGPAHVRPFRGMIRYRSTFR